MAILERGIQRLELSTLMRRETGTFIMAVTILALGGYLMLPVAIVFMLSFNTAADVLVGPWTWGLDSWVTAWQDPRIPSALWNTVAVWTLSAGVAYPIAVVIALVLARCRIPRSHTLEYLFWVAYVFPALANTIGWMMMLDPHRGFVNQAVVALPFIDQSPFNIFSFWGIVWTKLQSDAIAYFVILLTPPFRNMDTNLEEAARVSGASKTSTMLKISLPVMISPIMLVLALQMIRIFSGFETEWILGRSWGFYVYSTLIYEMTSVQVIPDYSSAVVLASVTMVIIGVIFPLQRWIVARRHYTTITGTFKPGLIDIGPWKWIFVAFVIVLLFMLTALPALVIVVGSFMARAGIFQTTPLWTLTHWQLVFTDPVFFTGLRTTTILAFSAGIGSPILFSLLAYLLIRTRWRGRAILDAIIWISAVFPGILSGLGLLLMFLTVPGLTWLYGSIWALILVVLISGNTTGTNIFKGVWVQIGRDMEEASRVAGAGWIKTYFLVLVPILMPTMVLIGMLNFIAAATTTANIILLASRDTVTLSIIGLEWASPQLGKREAAGIISLIIMVYTLVLAMIGRTVALRMGVQHERYAR